MATWLQADSLVHLGYTLMLCALLARDVLWLRVALVAAQATLASYGWLTDRPSMALWNALFVVINLVWSLQIYRQRRAVQLPEALAPLHASDFAALSAPEFLRLWRLGRTHAATAGEQLIARSTQPAFLGYVLAGRLRVMQDQQCQAELGPGAFIGEMSLLTGHLANADVMAAEASQLQLWPVPELQRLRSRNPELWSRIQSVLGRDLVKKIQRAASTIDQR